MVDAGVRPIGIVGLGRMGFVIARRLLSLGTPVVAFNRTPARAQAFEALGGQTVSSPAEVARRASLVLVAVSGPRDVRGVLLGPGGVREAARPGLVVVDLSTIDARTSAEVAAELSRLGVAMLDAPMSGSVHDAERGTLGLLVGGEREVLDRVSPALAQVASGLRHFGPAGAGCTAKLALNLLVAAMTQSLSEALAFLERAGASRSLFLEALSQSGLASPLFTRVGQRALAEDFEPRFSLALLEKDLGLLDATARELGAHLPLAQLLCELVASRAAEHGDRDYSYLVEAQHRLAGPVHARPSGRTGARSIEESPS